MKKKFILLLLIIILIVMLFKIKPFQKEKGQNNEPTVITSLAELFPNKETTFKIKDDNNKFQLRVKEVKKEKDTTTIVTEYDQVEGNETTTIETTYQIMPEKIVESGKHIVEGKVVSIIYPIEILVGTPYENMSWKSPDGLITNTVTSMKNNQVTIESVRVIDSYDEGNKTPIKKDYKETRVFEKGKGIVLYRNEIVGDNSTVSERKIVK